MFKNKEFLKPDKNKYPKLGAYYYDYFGKPVMNWLFWNRLEVSFKWLKKLNLLQNNLVALEAGCGGGITLPTLAKYFRKIIALDVFPEINIYQNWFIKEYPELSPVVEFLVGDITNLPFRDISFDVLEHIKRVDIAANEIFRVTKSGGHVCITIPTEGFIHHWGRWLYKLQEPDHYRGVAKNHQQLVEIMADTGMEIVKDIYTPINFCKTFSAFRMVIFRKGD